VIDAASATPSEIEAAVSPLVTEPGRAGALFDLDGTLAPLVDRPENTAVPAHTRELLERIAGRYALAGVVSGRQATEARRIVGLETLTYVGNHGFELLRPGDHRPQAAPALAGLQSRAAEFAAALDPGALARAGLRTEDKAAIVALHWRGAADEDAAEREANEIAAAAEAAGLHTHRGRMVLELRPPVAIDKGVALAALLAADPVDAVLYAGDDRTDADAFRALAGLVEEGRLARAVRVAVLAAESPAEVAAAADLAVDGPEAFVAVLEALA
jgi:trehalose 6-phosphate phosphatase